MIKEPQSDVTWMSHADRQAWERGIDPGLIDENLELTVLERVRQHDHYVRQILAVQERLGVNPPDES